MHLSVKEELTTLLIDAGEEYLSGEEIATRLQVSRTAVWKAVEALRADGCSIEAIPHRGYRMAADTDILSETGISRLLTGAATACRPKVYRAVESTNTLARRQADDGADEGLVILAGEQTRGRGRLGRSFYSPADSGLYMSLLLRPTLSADEVVLTTTAAAVAVAQAVESIFGTAAQIKWVNDIFVEGKKVCGILTEASFQPENGNIAYAVLGIGINMYPPPGGWPAELTGIAGALTGQRQQELRNRLAAEILNRFFTFYRALPDRSFTQDYRRLSMVLGKRIDVHRGDGVCPATALAIDDSCRLLVRYDDGREEALSCGEISIRLHESAL